MKLLELKNENSRKTLFLLGEKVFSHKFKSKFDKLYARRFEGLTEEEKLFIIKTQFKNTVGYVLNLDNPRTFNENFPYFVRTDFYEIGDRVLFSEFTFFSDNEMAAFYPQEWDLKLGKLISLPIEQSVETLVAVEKGSASGNYNCCKLRFTTNPEVAA